MYKYKKNTTNFESKKMFLQEFKLSGFFSFSTLNVPKMGDHSTCKKLVETRMPKLVKT